MFSNKFRKFTNLLCAVAIIIAPSLSNAQWVRATPTNNIPPIPTSFPGFPNINWIMPATISYTNSILDQGVWTPAEITAEIGMEWESLGHDLDAYGAVNPSTIDEGWEWTGSTRCEVEYSTVACTLYIRGEVLASFFIQHPMSLNALTVAHCNILISATPSSAQQSLTSNGSFYGAGARYFPPSIEAQVQWDSPTGEVFHLGWEGNAPYTNYAWITVQPENPVTYAYIRNFKTSLYSNNLKVNATVKGHTQVTASDQTDHVGASMRVRVYDLTITKPQ